MAGTTTLRPFVRGLAAGALGTAVMTLHQELVSRLEGSGSDDESSGGDEQGDPWESAPAPARVGKRLLEAVSGREVGPERIGLLTNAMHWGYGIANGGAYGLIRARTKRRSPLLLGPLFGLGVWASSYAQLVPMGLYEPPWTYPLRTVANELGYHLSYGSGTAVGFALVDRVA